MDNLRNILENVFFPQDNNTISLSFDNHPDAQRDIIDIMGKIKGALKSIGVDIVAFDPTKAIMTIVTTNNKKDEILRLAQDFKAVVVHNGFG